MTKPIDQNFRLGDLVQVKESHEFFGLQGKQGELQSFVGTIAAIVKFPMKEEAWDISQEVTDNKLFESYTWYIPLKHLERLGSNPDSIFSLLLEKEELELKVEAYKQALEVSEDLREKLSKEIDEHN